MGNIFRSHHDQLAKKCTCDSPDFRSHFQSMGTDPVFLLLFPLSLVRLLTVTRWLEKGVHNLSFSPCVSGAADCVAGNFLRHTINHFCRHTINTPRIEEELLLLLLLPLDGESGGWGV